MVDMLICLMFKKNYMKKSNNNNKYYLLENYKFLFIVFLIEDLCKLCYTIIY